MCLPAKSLVPTSTAHQRSTGNRKSRKYLPYPQDPLPLEQCRRLEEQLENGLSQMKTATLYKGYKAKLLTREVARQCLFLSTLEAEEADLTASYADAIHAENQEHFGSAEEELQHYRKHFLSVGAWKLMMTGTIFKLFMKMNVGFFALSTSRLIKLRKYWTNISHNLLRTTTEPFHEDSDVTPDGSDDIENEHLSLSDLGSDDLAVLDVTISTNFSISIGVRKMGVLMPHRELTISFNSLDNAESDPNQGLFDFIDQPEASHHGPFDSINQPQTSQAYPSSSSSYRGSALFGGVSGDQDTIDFDALAFGTFLEESGANASGTSTSHASTTASRLIPRSAEIDALYPLPPPQALQGTVERTQRSCRIPAPYPLPEPKVIPLSTTTTSTPQTLQHTTSVDFPVTPTIIAPTDLAAPIVTVSPIVPVAPIVISIDPAPQQLSAPVSIQVSADVQKQITQTAKTQLIRYLLTLHAMAGSDMQKVDSIGEWHEYSAVHVSNPMTSSQRQQLIGTWTSIFSNLIKDVWTCLPFAFDIYPPVDSNILPDEFQRRVINALINDPTQPLAFMHQFTVNAARDVTILDGVLDQPFILQMIIHFVWHSGTRLSEFIDDPLEEFNYLFAAIGAIAKLILFEQLSHPPVVITHTQLEATCLAISHLAEAFDPQKKGRWRMLSGGLDMRQKDSTLSYHNSGPRKHATHLHQRESVIQQSLGLASVKSNEGSMGIGRQGPPQKKDEQDISDYKPSGDSGLDTDAETDDDLEEPESAVKFLSAEIPKFVSMSEAERHDFLLTQPTWPRPSESTPKLTQKTESFRSKSTMATKAPMASRTKYEFNTRGHTSTPVWVDDSNDVEELEAASNDYADPKSPNDNDHHGDSQGPKLVWNANTGKLKLTDQDSKTHSHICSVTPVYDHLKTNESYVSALATLVDARVPLFRSELKDDACAQVTVYYHLGPDCVDTAKALLASHVYHYAQHFDEKNNPVPQAKKPYSADILPYLMKGCYFNGSKSVGMKFADRFKEIAGNKAQQPEVYAALLWKSNKSPPKFNFTANQFSEVYAFHVNFLNEMEENVPSKFHKLMADIFSAVQKLCSNGAAAVASHKDAMAFLDLDGMDDNE
ncbi:uncharacterized protein F5147DRAFT_647595 [Suillus discolor]|uniref:DUF6532 domain-containing protein n=1 Tax=Suillus discolor TaxID=1912936 RepID=A0A9P7FLG8_9AGAM|nr:uncharacterized protein F5147DRAFT_647595 [Suillus discolor]KAG2119698.1 hypothetical protein F5147DRAFT_647595 [Suillus discolor]